jgi:hypothetical protein
LSFLGAQFNTNIDLRELTLLENPPLFSGAYFAKGVLVELDKDSDWHRLFRWSQLEGHLREPFSDEFSKEETKKEKSRHYHILKEVGRVLSQSNKEI